MDYFSTDHWWLQQTLSNDSIVYDLNLYFYIGLNNLELILLVIICFKIRNVKDELSIHRELLWIAGFWIIFSFFYFLIFNLFYCDDKPHDDAWFASLNASIFGLIQLRNLSTIVISTIFCFKVTRSPNLVYTPTEDVSSLAALLDFDLVMMSVIPYSYFSRFVNKYAKTKDR